jgi:hypothetical protein
MRYGHFTQGKHCKGPTEADILHFDEDCKQINTYVQRQDIDNKLLCNPLSKLEQRNLNAIIKGFKGLNPIR